MNTVLVTILVTKFIPRFSESSAAADRTVSQSHSVSVINLKKFCHSL